MMLRTGSHGLACSQGRWVAEAIHGNLHPRSEPYPDAFCTAPLATSGGFSVRTPSARRRPDHETISLWDLESETANLGLHHMDGLFATEGDNILLRAFRRGENPNAYIDTLRNAFSCLSRFYNAGAGSTGVQSFKMPMSRSSVRGRPSGLSVTDGRILHQKMRCGEKGRSALRSSDWAPACCACNRDRQARTRDEDARSGADLKLWSRS
jgi:hypothetical protein